MDVVITYVDGLDPLWQKDYESTVGKKVLEKRFRDWGTLKYLLRGIELNMPFVRNVYLVVARDSQVPEWVDRSKLHIVLHRDIIPEMYLPVFNSTAIEMYLHSIPGLDEQFVYFNDDMFPVKPCTPEDFFPDGKIGIRFSRHIFANGLYMKQVRNSDRLARQAAGLRESFVFVRPQHICSPMLKSDCIDISSRLEGEISSSVTRLRAAGNYNQYLFLDYSYHIGHAVSRKLDKKHISMGVYSPERLDCYMSEPDAKFLCINDVEMDVKRYKEFRAVLEESFGKLFPSKSCFEL